MPDSTTASSDSRFDRQLAKILEHATAIFYEKGYEGASIRDLSRASGMSLAGLYYYFESKEKLLYVIQRHLFLSVMDLVRERLKEESDPERRIRVFILAHLEYFLANPKSMKVLSHEDDVLKDELGADIAGLKRKDYKRRGDVPSSTFRRRNSKWLKKKGTAIASIEFSISPGSPKSSS